MQKFTPGPWVAREGALSRNGNLWFIDVCVGDVCKRVADTFGESNAHLIAAAPDLLEALKLLGALLWQPATVGGYTIDQIVNQVNAAIQKAEGR